MNYGSSSNPAAGAVATFALRQGCGPRALAPPPRTADFPRTNLLRSDDHSANPARARRSALCRSTQRANSARRGVRRAW